ncbi:MAG: hypothetical protein Kow0062_27300 [Acidobacteriota bacterium]
MDAGSRPDTAALERLAITGRAVLRRIWARRDRREAMAEPERRLLELMERHLDARPFWEGADPDEHENPFLHVLMHHQVAEQIERDRPAGTRAAYERLVASGLEPHEAEHRLIDAWARELARQVRERRPFDAERYRAELDALS